MSKNPDLEHIQKSSFPHSYQLRLGFIGLLTEAEVLMPLNSLPPTTTVHALELELEAAAAASLYVDIGFWAGVVPSNVLLAA